MNERDLEHDDSVDALLREHHRSQARTERAQGRSTSSCDGFDANLAAAYEERSLSPHARRSFEDHLAACHGCRGDFADFSLTLRVDVTPTLDTEERVPLLARIRAFFGAIGSFSSPQLAMALSAVVVVLLGGFSWWIVANRVAVGPDVAGASKNQPTSVAEAPRAGVIEPSTGSGTTAPTEPKNATNAGVAVPRSVAPKQPAPAKPRIAPKAAPAQPFPEADPGATRSVDVGTAPEPSARIRRVGGKTFLLVGGVWTDREYVGRDRGRELATETLERGSAAFDSAVSRMPELAEYAKLGDRVTILVGETVYTIVGAAPK